jgi:hypothetical protein
MPPPENQRGKTNAQQRKTPARIGDSTYIKNDVIEVITVEGADGRTRTGTDLLRSNGF